MNKVFIFHGTEGYPEENWFPWMKKELESKGCEVIVPQFPSPPVVPAKIAEWFDVLRPYLDGMDKNTIIIGHSLGGVFTLRVLEKLKKPIKAAFLTGTPIGVKPILNYDRDIAFSGFTFDWELIRKNCKHFEVYQSDDDPYVGLENGKELSSHLGVKLNFIPNAGHFNKKAGYVKFETLRDRLLTIL
ncbi:MAG TPA: alpha/beta hydrolase [Candidatus Binatia bacterium]|nr:alpha/beta hydrolase [Candidatus Binatia bacterium]